MKILIQFKYWAIRGFYKKFRKKKVAKLRMSDGTPRLGRIFYMDRDKAVKHIGKDWYRSLML